MERRGRPKMEVILAPDIFTREYKDEDGTNHIWFYDANISKNGPFKVEISYPKDYKTFDEEQESLSITQRKYFNPANNKYVAYGRAKQLKLI